MMYTISENNSPVVFNRACKKLEEMFPNVKMERAIDVDGSVIQIFNTTLGRDGMLDASEEAMEYDYLNSSNDDTDDDDFDDDF